MQTKNHSLKKKATVGVGVVAIVAMLLTGTLAWTNFVQHKTNPFEGGEWVNVTLNDKYNPHEDWKPSDPAVDKKVSVTNTDESNRTAIIRLQFKEYMETYDMVPVQEGGKNVLFATYADDANKGEYMKWADVPAGYNYTKYTVNGVDYARTSNAELKNGIYGKAMYIQSDLNIYGTANKAQYVHEEQHTDECDYNVHKWDGLSIANRADATDQIKDYISWNLGSQVVKMSDWLTSGKLTGNFWILDDTDSESWVYWANPLAPGESTSNILESVKLNVMPGAKFEYYIHIDMEALTLDELTRTDAQQKWHGTDTESPNGVTNSSAAAKDLFDELKKPTTPPASGFKLTYNANGQIGSHEDTDIPSGDSYTVKSPGNAGISPSDEIFVFNGWNTAANGSGTRYSPGQTITVTGDMILYAQWVAVPPLDPGPGA